jgi:hypothetical protein
MVFADPVRVKPDQLHDFRAANFYLSAYLPGGFALLDGASH